MIDELYHKEKKYVKHYMREDYIEKNNFIFEISKSHALSTNKDMKRSKSPVKEQHKDMMTVTQYKAFRDA